jgi:hypothetical protein
MLDPVRGRSAESRKPTGYFEPPPIEPDYEQSSLTRRRGSLGLIIAACATLIILAVAATLIFLFWPRGFGTAAGINPELFKDGIGVYMFNNNQYNLLTWRKRLINPRGEVEEKDIVEAAKTVIPVQKSVRFYSYGIDYSKSLVVPPYIMAFCVVRDPKTVDGIFPIRIKPLNPNNYELLLPPIAQQLASGSVKYLFWTINFQYSCNEGWTFKFG